MKINIPLPFDRLGVGDEFLTADAVAEIGKTVLGGISSPGEQWTPESILDKIGRLHELGVSAVGVSATGRTRREWCDSRPDSHRCAQGRARTDAPSDRARSSIGVLTFRSIA